MPTAGTLARWTETPSGAVYFGLTTGVTVKRTTAGTFACLTCHRIDCAHAKVAEVEMDRLVAIGALASSRFASAEEAA